ncbi:hypothetical protein BT93_L2953 [Corymbia citriodora subsp. variegata]|uniref:TF-B3 domain-containing protein n=1 Tax=Corymbia citriodora subsp. variegata TaxID=360336 RepID=A0A8T0CKY2_CORYI|nr:hypothetical protein BT93_L2953 [Corymbia citriodora subsp. variegata]
MVRLTRQERELPEKGLKRNRSSGVSTELVLHDPWKIKKKLTKSDLGDLSRLMLPMGCLEDYMFGLMRKEGNEMKRRVESREGMQVIMRDEDRGVEHQPVLRRWESSGSYVLNCGWIKHFVKGRGLEVGDEIGMFWDPDACKFYFTVLDRVGRGPSNPAA